MNVTASSTKSAVKVPASETCAMKPGDDAAEPDAEVHRQPLLRVGGVAATRGREARDQRRLARPEAGRARALDDHQGERLPRRAHERHQPEADALQDEPGAERRRVARRGRSPGPRGRPPSSCAADETATTRPAVPSPNPRTSWR